MTAQCNMAVTPPSTTSAHVGAGTQPGQGTGGSPGSRTKNTAGHAAHHCPPPQQHRGLSQSAPHRLSPGDRLTSLRKRIIRLCQKGHANQRGQPVCRQRNRGSWRLPAQCENHRSQAAGHPNLNPGLLSHPLVSLVDDKSVAPAAD